MACRAWPAPTAATASRSRLYREEPFFPILYVGRRRPCPLAHLVAAFSACLVHRAPHFPQRPVYSPPRHDRLLSPCLFARQPRFFPLSVSRVRTPGPQSDLKPGVLSDLGPRPLGLPLTVLLCHPWAYPGARCFTGRSNGKTALCDEQALHAPISLMLCLLCHP